jgi:APA family basic amino acid/polyamine antiporter
MLGLPWETWERLFIWMALGMFIYFFFSRKHSKLA